MTDGKYRSIFHSPVPAAEAFQAARDELRAWLRSKNYDLDAFDRGDPRVGTGAVLLHTAANSADGAQTERWRLRESKDDGSWLSSLTVHVPASTPKKATAWFWIEIEFAPKKALPGPSADTRAAVPRLVRNLLTRVTASDSLALLTSTPQVVGPERVDELIDVLCDPDRRLPAVVASAHPAVGFGEWTRVVTRVAWYLPGLASMYVLTPLATEAFNEAIGRAHAVWGGALRTYLPDVDPAVEAEALRHRVLSGTKIAADPGRAAGIVSVLPRRLAVETPLPAPLAGVNRALLTQDRGAADLADAEGLQAQINQLEGERDLALDLAEEQEARANSLFDERESALAELTEREQLVLDLQNQVRALQKHLVAAGRHQEAFTPPEEAATPPATFAELMDWIEADLTRVEFAGDVKAALDLDKRPESSTWVRSAWEALRALQSYGDAKSTDSFAGDFKTWCENPLSEAYAIPAGKVARDESETVRNNAQWRREREFPVPAAVSPARRVFMGAHVRIGASAAGRISPRLYFHDASSQSGTIYVGYLGPHLTNTRS